MKPLIYMTLMLLLLTGTGHSEDKKISEVGTDSNLVSASDVTVEEGWFQEEPLLPGCWGSMPMFGQLLDDDTGSGRAAEARKDFERQMQGIRGAELKKRKHLEQFRLLKLMELLDLDEAQEGPFIQSFTSLRRDLKKVDGEKREKLDRLAAGVHAADISDAEIHDLINEIMRTDEKKRELFARFLDESEETLTARQLAKFVVFQERFEFELLENIREFQGRRRQGVGPGGMPGGR